MTAHHCLEGRRSADIRHRHGFVARIVALAMLCVWSGVAHAQRVTPPWTLPALMTAMHQVRESSARFVETKYLHLLNQAQKSSGRLIYVAPDRLEKQTTEPSVMRLTVAGDRLTIERVGEKPKDISLRDYSEVAALVDSVRATLSGDLAALTRHFAATLSGDANAWILTLEPAE